MRVRFGPFFLDARRRQLLRDGREIHLSPKALQLLGMLIERRPDAVSKKQLYDGIWPGTFVEESNVASLAREVRRALGDDARASRFVRTVHGYGYAFCAEASEITASADSSRRESRGMLVQGSRIIPLHDGDLVLGRVEDADLVIDDTTVSRRHAIISVQEDCILLRDLGSKNGTWISGERLEGEARLSDGDAFDLGSVRLEYRRSRDDATMSMDKSRGSTSESDNNSE